MASVMMASISVKPASLPSYCGAAVCGDEIRSSREIIEAEHRGEQRGDDAGNRQPHHDRDDRYRQRDHALDHQPDLLLMDVGGFERHRRKLRRFLAELQEMDRARGK